MSAPSPMRARVREEVARDLRPVRPLHAPLVRALLFVPVGLGVLIIVPLRWGFRPDLDVLGPALAWGASILQAVAGVLIIAAALREAIPDRAWRAGTLAALGAAGFGLVLSVTAITYAASPAAAPPELWWPYGVICARTSAMYGLPALLLAALLASRAWPLRPAATGALYGLGAGLISDAGWRLFCEVSAPDHVLTAHGGAVVSLVVIGAGVGKVFARLRG